MSTITQAITATANWFLRVTENFRSVSPAALYGIDPATTTGLTLGYLGGNFNGISFANGTVAITASNTNYVVAHRTTGVVTAATTTTNWLNTSTYLQLYEVVAGASTMTSIDDKRQAFGGTGGGGGGSTDWGDLTSVPAPIEDIAALTDPGADCLLFWDDSAGEYTHLTPGTNLSIAGTTLNAAGGGVASGLRFAAELGSTADSDPGAGLLKWNNATQASATFVYVDDDTTDGASVNTIWTVLDAGGFLFLQHATNAAIWQQWEITSVVDASGYAKLGIYLLARGGDFADGDPMLVTIEQGVAAAGVVSVNGKTGVVSELQSFIVACSDDATNITTGTAKATFRMPYPFTVTAVRASLKDAQAAGAIFTVDINEAGVSILSTKLTIDNTEKTSVTAATAPVIASPSLSNDGEITIDVDQVGTALAKGLKVTIIGYPT